MLALNVSAAPAAAGGTPDFSKLSFHDSWHSASQFRRGN